MLRDVYIELESEICRKVWKKEFSPCEGELAALRRGEEWDPVIAILNTNNCSEMSISYEEHSKTFLFLRKKRLTHVQESL